MTQKEKRIIVGLKIVFTLLLIVPITTCMIIAYNFHYHNKTRACASSYDCVCSGKTCNCLYKNENNETKKVNCPYNREEE